MKQANALNIAGTGFVVADGAGNFPTMTATDTSGAVLAVSFNTYIITTTCTSTLPASPKNGDLIQYLVDTSSILTIQANTGQFIRIGTAKSISAGICTNTFQGDSINLMYHIATTSWCALGSPEGSWIVT
jgi:hypothetical protein